MKKFLPLLLFLTACTEPVEDLNSNDQDTPSDVKTDWDHVIYPELSESVEGKFAALYVAGLEALYTGQSPLTNEETTVLLEEFLTPSTRGIIGAACAGFKAAIELYMIPNEERALVLGVMNNIGAFKDKKKLTELYYAVSPAQRRGYDDPIKFWNAFSTGKIDERVPRIYNDIFMAGNYAEQGGHAPEEFFNTCIKNNITPANIVVDIAKPLIEAGQDLVIASAPDLISWGKTAYDIINADGSLVMQIASGNISNQDFIKAANENIKLFAKGLEKCGSHWIEDGDIFDILADFTAEQAKELQQCINLHLEMADKFKVSSDDIQSFITDFKKIAGINDPEHAIPAGRYNGTGKYNWCYIKLYAENEEYEAHCYFFTDPYNGMYPPSGSLKWRTSDNQIVFTSTRNGAHVAMDYIFNEATEKLTITVPESQGDFFFGEDTESSYHWWNIAGFSGTFVMQYQF